ncbi:guanylate kinase [Streptacidiphilus sp. PB12-B1b]|uniref:guanylate kinase n=1 Tax=Streptacidiphilus sp. PB12-B1b TaxID=2705012 RepID=UPI0015FCC8F3|nr:guanylate kinase [Streptacidiphilus sp. PB12-B1b]QMU75709.1 guanylate kinase [Streptacidiphilus sp. PB12-B1b]
MNHGIVLYGPPASGKDTVTAALQRLDGRIRPFTRLKIGGGRTQGYRLGTPEQLRALEADGDVLYRNERYGNTYVVDRPGLDAIIEQGAVPVVHLGQIIGVEALVERYPARWLLVRLDCPRDVTRQRSIDRGDADTEARLDAWDATAADLAEHPDTHWHVQLATHLQEPEESARWILKVPDFQARSTAH